MCGIAGVVNLDGAPVDKALIKRMTDAIAHRGPDGEGQWVDGNVGLGHRRLAIIDLSEAAAQPMAIPAGPVMTFNGEIYNFMEIRAELEALGHGFVSRSDTEVVLHAYAEWGPKMVERLDGMFALAIWDPSARTLFLARDRFGVKPIYWTLQHGAFLFGSEIKAILEHPLVERRVCYEALHEYFTFQNTLSDKTLFEGIRILPAASTLTLRASPDGSPRIDRYWNYSFAQATDATEAALVPKVLQRFEEAVERQLVSDVPVGAYLSGGMDSSSICAVAVRRIPRLTTFTGGFDLSSASGMELGFDERRAAEMLASQLKTEQYEVVMHAGDMERVLPKLVHHLEDLRVGQCYPNYYVSRLASRFVKVVLSGAGGDELFGGYPWRYYRAMEAKDRAEFLQLFYGTWQRLIPDEDKAAFFNDETLARIGKHSAYDAFSRIFDGYDGSFDDEAGRLNAALYFDLRTFLHGLLVVEDKISMAHSLETRVPFLDNALVDLALRIPPEFKVARMGAAPALDENVAGKRRVYEAQTKDGKIILRKAMSSLVPPEVIERAKQGFSAPDASWFRGESIDYVNRLLRAPDARIYGFLRREHVTKLLDEHTVGARNHRLLIWSLLCFEHWLKEFIPPEAAA